MLCTEPIGSVRTVKGRCGNEHRGLRSRFVNHMGHKRMDTLYEPSAVRNMSADANDVSAGCEAIRCDMEESL